MQFERGKDVKKALGIGLRNKRVFNNVEEAVQWAILFPEEYTNGIVHDWFGENPESGLPFFAAHSGKFDSDALHIGPQNLPYNDPDRKATGKLQMVKWAKGNLNFDGEGYSDYRPGLKECKMWIDRLEEVLAQMHREKNRTDNPTKLDKIIEFIEDIERPDSTLKRKSRVGYSEQGWDDACMYIKQFIEGLK